MIINGDGRYGLLAAYIGGPVAQASFPWSKGRRPPGAVSVFIAWIERTLAMALLWWQHYKYRHGYYYCYIISVYICLCVCVTRPAVSHSCAECRINDDIRSVNGRLCNSPVSASRQRQEPRASDADSRDAGRESEVKRLFLIIYVSWLL